MLGCFVLLSSLPADPLVDTAVNSRSAGRPTVALVLEGGGALGLAHIGVIQVIEELGIPVDIVVGTSMGSIVGGLYAAGYDAGGLQQIVEGIDWQELFSEHNSTLDDSYRTKSDRSRYFASVGIDRSGLQGTGGLLSGKKILTYMDCLVSGIPSPVDFDALPRRFRAVAADISTGEAVVLQRGSISDAMRASMSIVGVFAPYMIENRYLMDGGIVNNLPVDVARSMGADVVIAVDLLGGFLSTRDVEVLNRTPLEYLSQTMDIMVRSNVAKQLPGADYVITVDLHGFTIMDFSKSTTIIHQGETAARANLNMLIQLRDRLGKESDAGDSPELIPFTALGVSGGRQQDNEAVKSLLLPFVQEHSSPELLAMRAMRLYAERSLDNLRVQRGGDEGTTLLVHLESQEIAGTSLRLGINYSGTYTDRVSSQMVVTPGLLMMDWPWAGSEFSINLEMMNTLRLEGSLLQNLADIFFLRTDFLFRHDFETISFLSDDVSDVDYVFYRTVTSIGASAGVHPFPGAIISVSMARDWNQDTIGSSLPVALLAKNVTMLKADARILRTDASIFPMDGFSMEFEVMEGIPVLGADSTFLTLASRGAAYVKVKPSISCGFLWNAGVDFSGSVDGQDSAPLVYKPNLADRRLFPALLTADEQIGTYVGGAGLEMKLRSARLSRAVGVPSFILAQLSAGSVIRDASIFEQEAPAWFWSTSIGTGVRISEGFGFQLRAGVSGNLDALLVPYFSIDVGALGYCN